MDSGSPSPRTKRYVRRDPTVAGSRAERVVDAAAFAAAPLDRHRFLTLSLCAVLACFGQGFAPALAQSFVQSAKCGTFYDKWNVPGTEAATLATVGMAHETFAARDCITQKNIPTACEHYRNVLEALEKMGPELAAEFGPDIKTQMADINCEQKKSP